MISLDFLASLLSISSNKLIKRIKKNNTKNDIRRCIYANRGIRESDST
jgi:hypothetical protein